MFQWFSRTTKQSLPSYSLLRTVPSRCLPQELADREVSSDCQEWRDRIECDLVAQGCGEDEPNFVTCLKSGNGLLQMLLPQLARGGMSACLLYSTARCRLRQRGCAQTDIRVLLRKPEAVRLCRKRVTRTRWRQTHCAGSLSSMRSLHHGQRLKL
jgi:hypothetical protein